MLTHFFSFRWSGISSNISGFFITGPILIFKNFIISTILHMLNKKLKNVKMYWVDSNLRQYFFIDTHDLQEQNFLINKLLQI